MLKKIVPATRILWTVPNNNVNTIFFFIKSTLHLMQPTFQLYTRQQTVQQPRVLVICSLQDKNIKLAVTR